MRRPGIAVGLACLALFAGWAMGAEEPKWTGLLGRAGDLLVSAPVSDTAPVLKTEDAVYYLKLAPDAPQALKEDFAKIVAGTLKGDYVVTGALSEADGKKWITISSLTQKPPAPSPTDKGKKRGGKGGKRGRR